MPESAARARAVLLFGGLFDPPHRTHVDLACAAREAVSSADGVEHALVFVPAAGSPHKPQGAGATAAQRVEMLRLALGEPACAEIWTDEVDRATQGEPSYWVTTLGRARRVIVEGARLRFLIGSDQAAAFHRWRDAGRILELARPVVMLRPPHADADSLLGELGASGVWSDAELAMWRGSIVDLPASRRSSTDARALLDGLRAAGPEADEKRAELLTLLRPEVLDYIERHALYGAGG